VGASDHDSRRLRDCRERHRLRRPEPTRRFSLKKYLHRHPAPGDGVGLFDRARTLEAFSAVYGPAQYAARMRHAVHGGGLGRPRLQTNVVFRPQRRPGRAWLPALLSAAIRLPTNSDAQFGVGGSYTIKEIGTKFGAYYSHVDYSIPTAAVVTLDESRSAVHPERAGQSEVF